MRQRALKNSLIVLANIRIITNKVEPRHASMHTGVNSRILLLLLKCSMLRGYEMSTLDIIHQDGLSARRIYVTEPSTPGNIRIGHLWTFFRS
jgi:hypothetical protein